MRKITLIVFESVVFIRQLIHDLVRRTTKCWSIALVDIDQPFGDTVMANGISRAMRIIPATVDIAKDVHDIRLNAGFFSFANPTVVTCTALQKMAQGLTVGLCHGVIDTPKLLACRFVLPTNEIDAFYAGLNHLTVVYGAKHRGRNLFEKLPTKVEEHRARGIDSLSFDRSRRSFDENTGTDAGLSEPSIRDLFERIGVISAPGEWFDDLEDSDVENEHLVSLINALESGEPSVFSADMVNGGLAHELPNSCVLEVPPRTDKGGLKCIARSKAPSTVATQLERHSQIADLTVHAPPNGDTSLWLETDLLGGYLPKEATVDKLIYEMNSAHRAHPRSSIRIRHA